MFLKNSVGEHIYVFCMMHSMVISIYLHVRICTLEFGMVNKLVLAREGGGRGDSTVKIAFFI